MVILIPIFLVAFVSVLLVVRLSTSYFKSKHTQQLRTMLRRVESAPGEQGTRNLLKQTNGTAGFGAWLDRFSFIARLDLIIEQAGAQTTSSKVLIQSFIASGIGFFVVSRFSILPSGLNGLLGALLGGWLPMMLLLRKRRRSVAEFEKQLPDALDFLSRSMRAGHGFSIAVELLAEDSPDPLGRAFRRVSKDMLLGSSLDVALTKLSSLVPLLDVRFFVSSVLLQQETGGNLSEILGKLALIIRERFRVKGQVKAVSAHGRITGSVLILMPLAVAAIMMVTSPQYLRDLANDSLGRMLLYGAGAGQVVGYLVIRKITDIKI